MSDEAFRFDGVDILVSEYMPPGATLLIGHNRAMMGQEAYARLKRETDAMGIRGIGNPLLGSGIVASEAAQNSRIDNLGALQSPGYIAQSARLHNAEVYNPVAACGACGASVYVGPWPGGAAYCKCGAYMVRDNNGLVGGLSTGLSSVTAVTTGDSVTYTAGINGIAGISNTVYTTAAPMSGNWGVNVPQVDAYGNPIRVDPTGVTPLLNSDLIERLMRAMGRRTEEKKAEPAPPKPVEHERALEV